MLEDHKGIIRFLLYAKDNANWHSGVDYMETSSEKMLKEEIARTMVLLYQRGQVTPTAGNVSARLPRSKDFWITPRGSFKADVSPNTLVKCSLDGTRLKGGKQPSIETPTHAVVYRTRQDVNAVIHAHCPISTGMALSGVNIESITADAAILLRKVSTIPYLLSGRELADGVGREIKDHDVIMVLHHGAIAVGKDLLEALSRIEVLESTAVIMTAARIWGKPRELSKDQIEKIRQL